MGPILLDRFNQSASGPSLGLFAERSMWHRGLVKRLTP